MKVYIGPEFYQTVSMIKAVASILNFAEVSCGELERLKDLITALLLLMNKQKDLKMAA